MPFRASDLRYRAEQSYPVLYTYLQRHAQQSLGSLKYDAYELDIVVGHVVEQLVRLGLLGGGDRTPMTALDHLTEAQFYAFLNRSIKNKAIDRLRKRRLQVSTAAELETPEGSDIDEDPLNEAIEPLWGPPPFATPEEAALGIASQLELRNLLKHCIKSLSAAPRQLQAVLQEIEEIGATDLLQGVIEELQPSPPTDEEPLSHLSQHKDHAHKKIRHCLQQNSTNLAVTVALRLTEYGKRSTNSDMYLVDIQTLVESGLSESDVRKGLQALVAESVLDWQGEAVIGLTVAQMKHLSRFYKEE